ncbi:MAG: DUF3037 domain-containing protein [Bryobacterales bacterium]
MAETVGSAIDYRFELLRYVPNVVAGEAFNIGVLLYDGAGRLLDARFAQEFRRLKCHPLVDFDYLHALRNEFEDRRLTGEGFSDYVTGLKKNLSNSLQISTATALRGESAVAEIERLFSSYVATPVPADRETGDPEPQPGSRRALKRRMDDAFRSHQLFANGDRLRPDARVSYGSARLQFSFDYAYQPDDATRYVHGLALNEEIHRAEKLCFVYDRLRGRQPGIGLTVVLDDGVQDDVKQLLESSEATTWEIGRVDELAFAIRTEMGL